MTGLAVMFSFRHLNASVELSKRVQRDVESGEHTVRLHEKHAAGADRGRHRRRGRDVAAPDILLERAPDDVLVIGGFQSGQYVAHVFRPARMPLRNPEPGSLEDPRPSSRKSARAELRVDRPRQSASTPRWYRERSRSPS